MALAGDSSASTHRYATSSDKVATPNGIRAPRLWRNCGGAAGLYSHPRSTREIISLIAGFVWMAIGIVLVAALGAAIYFAYHKWHGRGRFTADTLYHRRRARLGFAGFSLSGLCLLVLVLLLGISR